MLSLTGISNGKGRLLGVVAVATVMTLTVTACTSSSKNSPTHASSGTSTGASIGSSTGSGITTVDGSQMLTDGKPINGGTLRLGQFAGTPSLDPDTAGSSSAFELDQTIYDQLLVLNNDGTVTPDLATSMTTPDSGKTWIMNLPTGVSFTDGTPFNAAAVVAHFVRFSSPTSESQVGFYFAPSAVKMTATNPTTVTFVLTHPNSQFNAIVASYTAPEVESPTAVAKWGKDYGLHPVGVGAYMVKSFQPNGTTVLIRNPNYRLKNEQHLNEIIATPVENSTAALAAMQSGSLDATFSQNATDFATAKSDGLQVLETASPEASNVLLNLTQAPFKNASIRKALLEGINIKGLNQVVYNGLLKPMTSIFPPNSQYYEANGWPGYNPSDAKKLVSAYISAGNKSPTFQLDVFANPAYEQTAALLQQQWSQVGIKVSLKNVDQATQITEGFSGRYQAQLRFYMMGPPISVNLAQAFQTGNPINVSHYSNSQVDGWLNQASASAAVSAQSALYKQVGVQVSQDLPFIPLLQLRSAFFLGKNVHGFPPGRYGVDVFDLRDVWMSS